MAQIIKLGAMTALESRGEESKVLKAKAISYLKGMLARELSNNDYKDAYEEGKSLRPKDTKLAEKTEKEEILTVEAIPFTIEGMLNEIVNGGAYGDFFVKMISKEREKPVKL